MIPRIPASIGLAALLGALGPGASGAAAAASPLTRPWTPPQADSVLAWAAEARSRFQAARGDSATGPNQRAYDLVGKIGRRMLLALGRGEWLQAPAIEAALDSLKLDADVRIDPELPFFALVVVRNPHRPHVEAVGYLYWFRDDDLRYQGVVLERGIDPRMRVWWTSRQEAPYTWGILSRAHDPAAGWRLVLLRLAPDGNLWRIAQYGAGGPDFGGEGEAHWTDVNGDRQPEIVAWAKAQADSGFEECASCPGLRVERIFVERERGFELHDHRLLPSPYASFVLFVRLLGERNRAGAARLVQDPARVQEALDLGWGRAARGPAWRLEYVEPRQPWPRWLALRHLAGAGRPLYVVHFTMKDGRWIVRDWGKPKAGTPEPAGRGG